MSILNDDEIEKLAKELAPRLKENNRQVSGNIS